MTADGERRRDGSPEGRGEVGSIAIDVSLLARRSVHSLRSHLVTRPTGRAVRLAIESQLAGVEGAAVSLIDLSEVSVLDFSCADEVVAKLLRRYLEGDRPGEAFFVFRGVRPRHRAPVEAVLQRHGLATVVQGDEGGFELVGEVSAVEREAWALVQDRGRVSPGDVEDGADPAVDAGLLDGLVDRRVVFRSGPVGDYLALSALVRDLL